jgi:aspartate aminotransferase/aminotransferase
MARRAPGKRVTPFHPVAAVRHAPAAAPVTPPAGSPPPSHVVAQASQALSIRYNNEVYEMKRRGEKVITLSLGEAFFDIPLYPMDDLPHPALFHYSHSRGVPELREKVAQYYGAQYGVPVDPESEIILTAGSKAAIQFAMMSVLNPGDEVLIQEPAWVSYPEQVKLCYGEPVMLAHDTDVREYERRLTERTKLIIVNNPHNPRGEVMRDRDLRYLVHLARANELYVLSDEAYSDFGDGFLSLGTIDPDKTHSIICNSISKNFGISGWRLGYAITNPGLAAQILKVNQHVLTCPATILQYYVAKHFEDIIAVTRPQIDGVVERRREIARYLDTLGLERLPGDATFYFFVSIAPSALSSEEFCLRLLREDKVSAVPGIGYGDSCDAFIRVSIGTESIDDIQLGLRKIKSLIDATT